MNYYLKYALPFAQILEILKVNNKKKVNIFIDLQSICKGFYNRETVLIEIGKFVENNNISDMLIDELCSYLNNIYMKLRYYDPYFVIFYDDGFNQQNKSILSGYKSGRMVRHNVLDDEHKEIFKQIKTYYFNKIEWLFKKPDLSHVFYLKQYESDFIPHYCIMNNLFDSNNNDVLNVILSVDKDLLQTTKFTNTIQSISNFKRKDGQNKLTFNIYDNNNAIQYLHDKFKVGILTAKYIPLILSIAGDNSDSVPGIKGIGVVKACDLIINNNIPSTINEIRNNLTNMPKLIQDNFKLIENNMYVTCFEEQLRRIKTDLCLI